MGKMRTYISQGNLKYENHEADRVLNNYLSAE